LQPPRTSSPFSPYVSPESTTSRHRGGRRGGSGGSQGSHSNESRGSRGSADSRGSRRSHSYTPGQAMLPPTASPSTLFSSPLARRPLLRLTPRSLCNSPVVSVGSVGTKAPPGSRGSHTSHASHPHTADYRASRTISTPSLFRVFITDLPPSVSSHDLQLHFQQFGPLSNVYVPPRSPPPHLPTTLPPAHTRKPVTAMRSSPLSPLRPGTASCPLVPTSSAASRWKSPRPDPKAQWLSKSPTTGYLWANCRQTLLVKTSRPISDASGWWRTCICRPHTTGRNTPSMDPCNRTQTPRRQGSRLCGLPTP
jgi:hypothetical protein